MGARKPSNEGTGSLFIASAQKEDLGAPANRPTSLVQIPGFPVGTPVVSERTFRVVPREPAQPESQVIVEMVDEDAFVVSLLRHHGTTVAAVRYSRSQLEQLVSRATAALEAG